MSDYTRGQIWGDREAVVSLHVIVFVAATIARKDTPFILTQIRKSHDLIYFLSAGKTFRVWMITTDENTLSRNTGVTCYFGKTYRGLSVTRYRVSWLVWWNCEALSDLSVFSHVLLWQLGVWSLQGAPAFGHWRLLTVMELLQSAVPERRWKSHHNIHPIRASKHGFAILQNH